MPTWLDGSSVHLLRYLTCGESGYPLSYMSALRYYRIYTGIISGEKENIVLTFYVVKDRLWKEGELLLQIFLYFDNCLQMGTDPPYPRML